MEKNPETQVALSAILPREVSFRKNDQWADSAKVLQQHSDEARETNLQEFCRKERYGVT